MQGEPGPAPQGLDAIAPVFHDAPVRIPFAAPAPAPRPPSWPASLLLSAVALAWIGAALDHPSPAPVAAALGFGLASAADLAARALRTPISV